MSVNANSVIPVWLKTFSAEFYTSLTDKEDWSYTNQGAANWQPLFQQLATALDTYKAHNRSDEVFNFMNASYAYAILHYNFGTDGSSLNLLVATNVYSIGGFMAQTLSRPTNYYSDLLPPVPPDTAYTSANMTADVLQVTNAPTAEASGIDNIQSITHASVQSFTSYSLWDDPVPVASVGKPFMKEKFFIDFGWKNMINSLNIGYNIPSGV